MSPLLSTFASATARGWNPGVASAGPAMELITTTVLSSVASSVMFSSIPATYSHLQLRIVTRGDNFGNSRAYLSFNSDTSSFTYHRLQSQGVSSMVSSGWASGTFPGGWVADVNGNDVTGWTAAIIDVLDYANTNKYKTARSFNGMASDTSSARFAQLTSTLWLGTAAVNTIGVISSVNNFDIGSRFSLYGIKG